MISFSPSKFESFSKVTPHKIITISKYFKNIVKEFFNEQSVVVGPTTRFKNSQIRNKFILKKRDNILLILSGIYKIDKSLVELVVSACVKDKNLKVLVKEHPIMPLKKIISPKLIPENFKQVNNNLDILLKKSLITIISGPTSAILESYNMNNILILPNIEIGTEINAVRLKIEKKKFFIVNDKNEFLKTVSYIKKNRVKLANLKVKYFSFFEQVNKSNTKIFN